MRRPHDSVFARAVVCFFAAVALTVPREAQAFWVVNFGPAPPLKPGKLAFAGGTGGQVVHVGEPKRTSAIFFIPHAGLRVGFSHYVDVGYRLAPMPLPFASVGPGLGGNVDFKFRLSPEAWRWQLAADVGFGVGHVLVNDDGRSAYSPNGALLVTQPLGERVHLTEMARYVYLAIPTAPGGAGGNHVHIAGPSFGLKVDIAPHVSVLPEVGAFWYEGRIGSVRTSGPAFQYGVVFASVF
jgi:hypothetical protein